MNAARVTAAAGVAVLVAATLPSGGRPFVLAVLVWAGVVLVVAAGLLARGGQRPLVPAAAVAALGVPVGALVAGSTTWERLPLILAAMVLATFLVALVAPRRREVTTTLSATVLTASITGLGSAGLLVLRAAGAGFRWTLGLLLLSVVPQVAAVVAERVDAATAALPARVVSAGAIGGALLLALGPPFGLLSTVVLTVLGLGAGWGAAALGRSLAAAGAAGQRPTPALAALLAPLLAAPVAAFLAAATSA